MGQILISVWHIWPHGTLGENYATLDANYSINHNSKVLIEDILDIDMCLSFQNLFLKMQICWKIRALEHPASEVSWVHTLKGIYFSELKNFVLSWTRWVHMPSAYIFLVVMFWLGKNWVLVRIVPDLWFILSVANNSFPGVSLQFIV